MFNIEVDGIEINKTLPARDTRYWLNRLKEFGIDSSRLSFTDAVYPKSGDFISLGGGKALKVAKIEEERVHLASPNGEVFIESLEVLKRMKPDEFEDQSGYRYGYEVLWTFDDKEFILVGGDDA